MGKLLFSLAIVLVFTACSNDPDPPVATPTTRPQQAPWITMTPDGVRPSVGIGSVAISGDAKRFAWASGSTVGVIDPATQKALFQTSLGVAANHVLLDGTGSHLYIVSQQGVLCLDESAKLLWRSADKKPYTELAAAKDGSILACSAGQVVLIDTASGEVKKTYDQPNAGFHFQLLKTSTDGATALVTSTNMFDKGVKFDDSKTISYALDATDLHQLWSMEIDMDHSPAVAITVDRKHIFALDQFKNLDDGSIVKWPDIFLSLQIQTCVFAEDGSRLFASGLYLRTREQQESCIFGIDPNTAERNFNTPPFPSGTRIHATAIDVKNNLGLVAISDNTGSSKLDLLAWRNLLNKK